MSETCGSGGTAHALASGASGGRARGGSNPLYRTNLKIQADVLKKGHPFFYFYVIMPG